MDFKEIIQSVRRAVTLDKSFYEEAALLPNCGGRIRN